MGYFRSQENSGAWKDLTSTGSETSFLIRLLANIFSTLSYRIVAQSRENYLSTAILPSSNVGISVNLGYSAFRGSNLKRRVTIMPTGNFTIPKLASLGSYDTEHEIFSLGYTDANGNYIEDITLEAGTPVEIDTVVGKVKEETFVTGTSDNRCFSLFTTGISEDYVLYLGSQKVPTTKVIKEMTEDKYLVRTNPYLSVDIMYLNNVSASVLMKEPQYKYGTGSEITIRYVQLEDVPVIPYTDSMFVNFGTLKDVTNISSYMPFESIDSMKINAPLQHETQNLIRSKQDYANRLEQIVPSIIDVQFKALTPTYTLITGLKDDFTLLTDIEKEGVQAVLKKENYFGTPLPDITHPRREVANLLIQVALTNKYKDVSDVDLDVNNILANYYDARLGDTFDTFDLERKIESLSYVKYARVSHVINKREALKRYQVGYVLYQNGNYYIASKILGMAGNTAPDWNVPMGDPPSQIDTGLITTDGSLRWQAFKYLPNTPVTVWTPHGRYGLGDYVVTTADKPAYMFKCVDLIESSGVKEPDLSTAEVGDFFVDGGVVWVAKAKNDSYPVWSSTTTYGLGESVNVSTSTDLSLECISYTGETNILEDVVFESEYYDVISSSDTRAFKVKGNQTTFFTAGTIFWATYSGGEKSFTVNGSEYDSQTDTTTINVTTDKEAGVVYLTLYTARKGTKDGDILWNLVDDINKITYPWNGYVVFDHVLEIVE